MNKLESIVELREKIRLCNKAYYEEDRSLIPDEAFDDLMRQLRELEASVGEVSVESPSQMVGGQATFNKVEHKVPMRSLDNIYTKEEIQKVLQLFHTHTCGNQLCPNDAATVLEVKLDGCSISCTYEKGRLVQALTRGDGKIGEDVTENVFQIASIPKELKDPINITVYGEIVMPKKSFLEVNAKRSSLGHQEFANPRNAAAGTLRQKDPKIVAERGLDCYFYFLAETLSTFHENSFGLRTHMECIRYMERLGFKTTGIFVILHTLDDIISQIKYWETFRLTLPYETDGLVLKCDCLATWKQLGYTSKFPKWAYAFKFKSEEVSTVLQAVQWFVGRTGVITPVAVFDKISLGGTQVQRASLHNYSYIQEKDLRIGDIVTIKKAAEIIPQVVRVMTELRTGREIPVVEPKHCPSCGKKVTKMVAEKGVDTYVCTNPDCSGMLREQVLQFVSRDAMNIQGFGVQTIEKLIQNKVVRSLSDLYTLTVPILVANVDHFQTLSAEKLVRELEKSKGNSMQRVLTGIGIAGFGKQMIYAICKKVTSLEELLNLNEETLATIPGVGEELRKNFLAWRSNPIQQAMIQRLREFGLTFPVEYDVKRDGPWNGMSFIFTGTLISNTRAELEKLVRSRGGSIASTINKANVLVAGSDAEHNTKYKEALSKNVAIWTEDKFIYESSL